MPRYADRVKETTTTTGTGDLTLGGAVSAYITFNTAFGVGPHFTYLVGAGTEWEVGVGHLSASTTLVRDRVMASSNSGALVNFAAGSKDAMCVAPAESVVDRGEMIGMGRGFGVN